MEFWNSQIRLSETLEKVQLSESKRCLEVEMESSNKYHPSIDHKGSKLQAQERQAFLFIGLDWGNDMGGCCYVVLRHRVPRMITPDA